MWGKNQNAPLLSRYRIFSYDKKFEVAWQLCWLKAQIAKKMIKADKNEQNQSLEYSLCCTWYSTLAAQGSCQRGSENFLHPQVARGGGGCGHRVRVTCRFDSSCWELSICTAKDLCDFLSFKKFWPDTFSSVSTAFKWWHFLLLKFYIL